MVEVEKLKSVAEWPKLRPEIEKAIFEVLGKQPKDRPDLQMKTIDEFQGPGYVRRRVNYFVDEWERVSAWAFIPDGKEEVPAVLCCHDRVPQGKDEPAGLSGDKTLAFAQRYADMGYVTLAPDTVTAGERVPPGLSAYQTKQFYKDRPRMSVLGKMLWDHIQAIDALCDLNRVDQARMGVIGHGLGGLNALLLSAFEERVHACVASCAFTRFQDDKNPDHWSDDGEFALIPKLKERLDGKDLGFDWEHVLALAAPNPILLFSALNDDQLSNTKSCEKAVKAASTIYKMLGRGDALSIVTHKDGRCMKPEHLELADEWFERWL